jgi:hypothetical protein
MVTLLQTPLIRSEYDERRRLVRYTRTSQGFSSIHELEETYKNLIQSTVRLDLRHLALLIDLREAPPRNDPAFEEAIARYRGPMMQGFARVAVLVKSAVGRLQVRRHAANDGIANLVTQDEDEALRYLGVRGSGDV